MAANRGPSIPTSAYVDHHPYHQGRNDRWPDMNFSYKYFTRIMNIPLDDCPDGEEALKIARAKHGPDVKILRTARFWVAFRE